MACVALAPRATFVATGSDDGRMFVWEVATGALLCSIEAHYRKVTAIRWTSDGAAIVTGGADARVCVWSTAAVLRRTDLGTGDVPSPYATFSDHTLPITDLHVTVGLFPGSAKVWSASADATVKVWDLGARRLVSTYNLPHAVVTICVDPLERFFFAGADARAADGGASGKGQAYRVDLYTPRDAPHTWKARGGRGSEGEVERVASSAPCVYVKDAVTAIALSVSGSHVMLGTATGQVHIVDTVSLQTQRTFTASASLSAAPAAGTPVTNICSLLRPADLMDPLQLREASALKRGAATYDSTAALSTYIDALPAHPVATQFARSVVREGPAHVPLRIGAGTGAASNALYAYLTPLADARMPAHSDTQSAAVALPPATPHDVTSQAQVESLRKQLDRAKALNDSMWRHLVQREFGQS